MPVNFETIFQKHRAPHNIAAIAREFEDARAAAVTAAAKTKLTSTVVVAAHVSVLGHLYETIHFEYPVVSTAGADADVARADVCDTAEVGAFEAQLAARCPIYLLNHHIRHTYDVLKSVESRLGGPPASSDWVDVKSLPTGGASSASGLSGLAAAAAADVPASAADRVGGSRRCGLAAGLPSSALQRQLLAFLPRFHQHLIASPLTLIDDVDVDIEVLCCSPNADPLPGVGAQAGAGDNQVKAKAYIHYGSTPHDWLERFLGALGCFDAAIEMAPAPPPHASRDGAATAAAAVAPPLPATATTTSLLPPLAYFDASRRSLGGPAGNSAGVLPLPADRATASGELATMADRASSATLRTIPASGIATDAALSALVRVGAAAGPSVTESESAVGVPVEAQLRSVYDAVPAPLLCEPLPPPADDGAVDERLECAWAAHAELKAKFAGAMPATADDVSAAYDYVTDEMFEMAAANGYAARMLFADLQEKA